MNDSTPTYLTAVESATHDAHYRTTVTGQSSKVWIESAIPAPEGHVHHFVDLTRFGDAKCGGCDALGWSASWVADGVFGEGTLGWIEIAQRVEADKRLKAPTVTKPSGLYRTLGAGYLNLVTTA